MARLNKQQVEQLTSTYDLDPTGALLTALRIVLEDQNVQWRHLTQRLPAHISVDALQGHDIAALDQLLRHLIEYREL